MRRRRKHLRIAKRARHRGADRVARIHLRAARSELRLARAARKRSRSRGGISQLTPRQRIHARRRAVQAAWLCYRHKWAVHYTQGGRRWDGIRLNLQVRRGRYPYYADCSSFVTWCIWNGIKVPYGARDTVNGLGWRAGYTGTMLAHGRRVSTLMKGDAVIYGRGFPGHHTAIYVGRGMVLSHGSESGPNYLPVRYRGDVCGLRRYI